MGGLRRPRRRRGRRRRRRLGPPREQRPRVDVGIPDAVTERDRQPRRRNLLRLSLGRRGQGRRGVLEDYPQRRLGVVTEGLHLRHRRDRRWVRWGPWRRGGHGDRLDRRDRHRRRRFWLKRRPGRRRWRGRVRNRGRRRDSHGDHHRALFVRRFRPVPSAPSARQPAATAARPATAPGARAPTRPPPATPMAQVRPSSAPPRARLAASAAWRTGPAAPAETGADCILPFRRMGNCPATAKSTSRRP